MVILEPYGAKASLPLTAQFLNAFCPEVIMVLAYDGSHSSGRGRRGDVIELIKFEF